MPDKSISGESPLNKAKNDLTEVDRLIKEINRLRITHPDSPQIKVLENRVESMTASIQRTLDHHKETSEEGLRRVKETLEKVETLNLEVQRQLITLSATLIVALFALSEVFEDTPRIQATVGEVSSSLIYAIGASLLTIVFFSATLVDSDLLEGMPTTTFQKVLDGIFRWVGRGARLLHLVTSTLTFWFFFNGLLTLANFLSRM